jgi:hypothetical protein
MAEVPQAIPWLWEPMIPMGSLCILAAFMKTGKSTLLTALVKAVAAGEDFLGMPTQQQNVLLLAVEEHPRDVTHRFEEHGAACVADRIHVHSTYTVPTPALYGQITAFVREHQIGLVVVDTLSKWSLPIVEDENDNAQVLAATVPFLHLARETGAAVLLVHHTSKMEQEGGRGIRGASSLFGIVDQAMLLKRMQGAPLDGRRRVIDTFGRYAETPGHLIIELGDDLQYRLVASSDDGSVGSAYTARVVEVVTDSGRPLTSKEIADATGMNLRQAQRYAAKAGLRREGSGSRVDPYRWVLPGAPASPRLAGLLPAAPQPEAPE